MYWIKEMQTAIAFIEDNIYEDISVDDIARSANSSSSLTDSINETPFETERRVLSAIGWNAKYKYAMILYPLLTKVFLF